MKFRKLTVILLVGLNACSTVDTSEESRVSNFAC